VKARVIIAAAIMIVPTIARAQGGMGGMGGGGRRGGRGGRGESGSESTKEGQLKADDIQKLNPAKVLLDKRKDLKIDDTQKAHLETIANRYDWNSRVFVAVVDSLQAIPTTRKAGSLGEALQAVRQEYDTASAHALSVLTEAQRPQGAKLIEKPTTEIASQLEKVGFVHPKREIPGDKPPS
jgi:uncharacterized phage-associated protein